VPARPCSRTTAPESSSTGRPARVGYCPICGVRASNPGRLCPLYRAAVHRPARSAGGLPAPSGNGVRASHPGRLCPLYRAAVHRTARSGGGLPAPSGNAGRERRIHRRSRVRLPDVPPKSRAAGRFRVELPDLRGARVAPWPPLPDTAGKKAARSATPAARSARWRRRRGGQRGGLRLRGRRLLGVDPSAARGLTARPILGSPVLEASKRRTQADVSSAESQWLS